MAIPRKLIQFERSVVRERNKIETRGIKMAHAALAKQYKSFSEKLELSFNPDDFELLADSISSDFIEEFLVKYYGLFAPISLMYRNNAISQKSAITGIKYKQSEDAEYLSIFQQYIQATLRGEAGESIRTITSTSQDKIKGIIRDVLADAELQGQGIEIVKRTIMKRVGDNLRGNGWARSRAIAQTEMIKASNQAAHYAVDTTGFEYRKFWSNSGLKDIRDSHIYAQEAHPQGIGKEALFDMGNGNVMRYVGDPNGVAEEVINCRCTTLYEIV